MAKQSSVRQKRARKKTTGSCSADSPKERHDGRNRWRERRGGPPRTSRASRRLHRRPSRRGGMDAATCRRISTRCTTEACVRPADSRRRRPGQRPQAAGAWRAPSPELEVYVDETTQLPNLIVSRSAGASLSPRGAARGARALTAGTPEGAVAGWVNRHADLWQLSDRDASTVEVVSVSQPRADAVSGRTRAQRGARRRASTSPSCGP